MALGGKSPTISLSRFANSTLRKGYNIVQNQTLPKLLNNGTLMTSEGKGAEKYSHAESGNKP
jgi:hypothetical protein